MRTSNMMQTKNWMALVGLTCAAFIFNTSEFIPIGLLTDIANDFLTTEAQAGMIISIYAFVVMLLSLPLMIVVSRFEMKKLLSRVILNDAIPVAF
jgi:DHA1 family L-arabinose/isopropyl-beta-D-thiogalactopyranoside export protein-like MFS transporter